VALAVSACGVYQPLDPLTANRDQLSKRLPADLVARVELPYVLDEELLAETRGFLNPAGSERRRTEDVVDFIFDGIGLQYALEPTRDASETFRSREGNCMSFVNLFVALGRHQRLDPFYVEVEDYQRWSYRDGVVVSRGHIVAGIFIDGDLKTYDFLPYRAKSYRDFAPIDDTTAMAHFYNNLGAEALMEEDGAGAVGQLEVAVGLAPDFEKALNNLGVAYMHLGRTEEAVELYERALGIHPQSVPILTNLARATQDLGLADRANELLDQIENVNEINPFFFVYRGEQALAAGDFAKALDYMRRAFRIESEEAEVHVGLAKVYLGMGDLAKARHHVSRALKLDATHEGARKYAALMSRGDLGG
jgi:Flp pilus assembly protein TadD